MRREFITIIHEDDDILVIDKPAGLPCVPERHGGGETVVSVLADTIELVPGQPLRVVHRIDRDTSGILVLAKTVDAQRSLTEQFMARTIAKTYIALVRGSPDESAGRLNAPIGEMRGELVRVCINPKRGKPAVTEWELVERFVGYALLRCRPLTGRQHQIRLHLQLAGMPLAVDTLYGGSERLLLSSFKADYRPSRQHEERPLMGRLSLHAESIEFDHPATGGRMRWEAPLPRDFRATVNQLRKHAAIGPAPPRP
jgi:23S rRNA pseudouridine1911/1915/1917 synthase